MSAKLLTTQRALAAHTAGVQTRARILEYALEHVGTLGLQCAWLGSRTLGRDTLVYKWVAAVSKILAAHDIAQKTGGYAGLMEAPHFGCHLANRLDRVAAFGVDFIGDEDFNPYVTEAGYSVRLSDLNSRHDCLFFGTDVFNILPGRLGTAHEKFDLLNRIKLGLLSGVEVFLIDLHGYYSKQMEFQIRSTGIDLGPRISPADYELVKIVDMATTTPEEFAARILKIMSAR
jgi:predicted Rossmann-fold nucleotide-binding protein